MNKLEHFFWNKEDKLTINKWHHYFSVYERHFNKFIGKKPTILEIGIFKGGSIQLWNDYFDNECFIYAIDIDPKCLEIEKLNNVKNIKLELGNQEEPEFWRKYLKNKPKFDIVIDDGGHTMNQQIVTYDKVYNHMSNNGVYLCEDLHTSYWKKFGGGLRNPNSFIEYSKNFIDMLNSFHIKNEDKDKCDIQKYNEFRKQTDSIHYYDSIIVLEKHNNKNDPSYSKR